MPTSTFFNLSEDKKQRIIDAAILEFAAYPLSQSSVAHIVETAAIPRGSFYQYFENLKDLYKYVLSLVSDQKINYFHQKIPQLEGQGFDFFQTLRQLFVTGLEFARENPKLVAIGNNFLNDINSELKNEIFNEQLPKAHTLYAEMIKRGLELKQIDAQVDPKLALVFINSLNQMMMDYYLAVEKIAESENVINPLLNEDKLLPFVDQMLYLLANGLRSKTQEADS